MQQKIHLIRKRINRKKYIAVSLYLIFVLLSLFVVSSYTWFSLSKTPRVSNMNVYITSAAGLELSATPDAENWKLQLNVYETGMLPVELRPVTWSDADQRFWAAAYGADGRMLDIGMWQPMTDSRNANKTNLDGYYMKSTFYARSGMTTEVEFAPAMVVNEEGTQGAGTYVIGVPGWDVDSLIHLNNGKGAESSIRIGLRTTLVDSTGTPVGDQGPMFIYEPNIDKHVSSTQSYIPTPSMDGTPTLVPEDRMILQYASGWGDLDPAEMTSIKLTLGEFEKNPVLFTVNPGEIMRIEMYFWLEGQDIDCTNAMNGAQLLANVQFTGSTEAQSGMVSIPTE